VNGTTDRVSRLRERLADSLAPQQLEVSDDSHQHIGHAGARGGGGHFTVRIVAQAFADKTLLERHRMIYDLLRDMMHSEIHALSIHAHSPDELHHC
jgi:BolA protein